RLALISSQAFSIGNFRGPLVRELVQAGVEVFALAPDYDDRQRDIVRALGAQPVDISLDRTGMNPLRDGMDMLRLAAVLRRLRVDVSFAYFAKPVIYGTLAAWLARVPRRVAMIEGLGYVFTASGDRLPWRRRQLRGAVGRLYRAALAKAAQVIFLNSDDVDEFVSRGLVARQKAFRLGGIGVDLAEWPPAPPVLGPVTFVLAARLLREKGIAEYAEAARRVKARHPEARFVLLGGLDPNPGGLTRAEVEAWVAQGVLEWAGHVDVKPWLARASVYVLPSYYREGLPRSTQEAMAMGRPVITTDAPGCRETVIDGENGFLVPVRDVDALAERMSRFIEQPALIETMGRRSRQLAEERFDVRRINAQLLAVLGVTGAPQMGAGSGAVPRPGIRGCSRS
ncbi:glycosyltransferase family 4 protein, partial [Immundisolibacter sp.]|uniref:glycosyltransferase family 4 protein n=1 Tax=Immundisolibacter sp. TaxID=1934948 RepID=UPI00261B21EF